MDGQCCSRRGEAWDCSTDDAGALGERHPLTLEIRQFHGRALADEGRSEEAIREFRTVADGADDYRQGRIARFYALSCIAAQLCMMGRAEEAEARKFLEEVDRMPVGLRVYPRLSALNSVGKALVDQDRPAEAEETLRAALAESATSTVQVGNFQRILDVNLASALTAQGRHTEAHPRVVRLRALLAETSVAA
ncbi:hypothetical protein [Streptacidiphilus jiangxiensis]|uniref:Tetratricopeptide repeat-containing protein n=1 Tax=Streptacidiphilus jiangxiensis TaxID=235985 RepID=A0A1H7L2Z4_STRJI|nr:hypothetical protein [Streptacidiphilus jiangxiensis]SEK93371.1 hypothetical protein SAMN05414137_104317 [Streptacidiphilus jiangxiensis]